MFFLISQMEPTGVFVLFTGVVLAIPAYLITFLGSHMLFASLTKSDEPTPSIRWTVHVLSIIALVAVMTVIGCRRVEVARTLEVGSEKAFAEGQVFFAGNDSWCSAFGQLATPYRATLFVGVPQQLQLAATGTACCNGFGDDRLEYHVANYRSLR